MLSGHNIICFSSDWHQDPLSKHHIISRLAKHNKVLWINSIGMRKPTVTKNDLTKAFSKIKSFVKTRLEPMDKDFWVLNPLVFPFHGSRLFQSINNRWLLQQIRICQKNLDLISPILWSFLPNAVGVFGKLGEKLSIYYITDDFTKFTGHPSAAIERMEKELLDRADLVIASSRYLADIKRNEKSIYVVSHGVDHKHFSQALKISADRYPTDIRNIKRPIIGFYGEINDWLDLKMLAEVAARRPQWSLVLIGRIAVEVGDINYLTGLPNVHWLGRKEYSELPFYCAAFDAALIPMKINELTAGVNPLKLREYLAAGLPVVSTPLPEVLPYGDVVRFARTTSEWISEIDKILRQPKFRVSERLSRRVAGEDWEVKVEEISEIMKAALSGRRPLSSSTVS